LNYFPFNVGDYAAHTGHLEPMEDLAYRRLLDQYYLREGPLPADIEATAKLVRMRSMKADVESVLKEFFTLTDAGWTHSRCDAEIEKMQDKQAKARASGLASANARSKAQQASAERALMSAQANAERPLSSESTNVQLPTPTPTPVVIPSESKDSGDKPPAKPPVEKSKSQLWKAAVSLLNGQGLPEAQARTFIGKLAKDYPENDIVLKAVEAAVSEQPPDARAYLKATCQRLNGDRKRDGSTDWTVGAL
jgi:uncharacterized protein YdaU (DUF1376 family)